MAEHGKEKVGIHMLQGYEVEITCVPPVVGSVIQEILLYNSRIIHLNYFSFHLDSSLLGSYCEEFPSDFTRTRK
jgi:hypothetical protein